MKWKNKSSEIINGKINSTVQTTTKKPFNLASLTYKFDTKEKWNYSTWDSPWEIVVLCDELKWPEGLNQLNPRRQTHKRNFEHQEEIEKGFVHLSQLIFFFFLFIMSYVKKHKNKIKNIYKQHQQLYGHSKVIHLFPQNCSVVDSLFAGHSCTVT